MVPPFVLRPSRTKHCTQRKNRARSKRTGVSPFVSSTGKPNPALPTQQNTHHRQYMGRPLLLSQAASSKRLELPSNHSGYHRPRVLDPFLILSHIPGQVTAYLHGTHPTYYRQVSTSLNHKPELRVSLPVETTSEGKLSMDSVLHVVFDLHSEAWWKTNVISESPFIAVTLLQLEIRERHFLFVWVE